jgi:hypothetical protein
MASELRTCVPSSGPHAPHLTVVNGTLMARRSCRADVAVSVLGGMVCPDAPSPGRAQGPARPGGSAESGQANPRGRCTPGLYRTLTGLPVVRCTGQAQNELMRVVATRIEQDGTMQRRVVDTACCSDGPRWEDLACRALAVPPPYRPVPGTPIYHLSLDGNRQVLVAEHDLGGPLLDLVAAVLAIGAEVSPRGTE